MLTVCLFIRKSRSIMEQYYPILRKCGMFNNIQPRKYQEVLSCLNASVRTYPRGSHLVELGEPTRNTGVLLEGTLEEFLYDENGNQVSICRFASGEVFGAELACTGWSASPVCLRASSDCTVMLLDFAALLSQQTLTCPCRMQVTANLMQDMAQQLLFFNTKVRILAQKRLRDRLKIYLQTLTPAGDCYTLPYNRTELADFLCVDRSALSRELCRMRDEGILRFAGNKLYLMDPEFLGR